MSNNIENNIVRTLVLNHYHGKIKQYIKDYVGRNAERKQIDLSADTSGTYELTANTLYILPRTNLLPNNKAVVSLIQPTDNKAQDYEFIIVIAAGGSVELAGNITIKPGFVFVANTPYLVRIVAGYATIEAIGTSTMYYLLSNSVEASVWQANVSGYYLQQRGLCYNPSSRAVVKMNSDNSIYMEAKSDGGGTALATTNTKNTVPVRQLYEQGYRNLHVKYNVTSRTNNSRISVIVSSKIDTVNSNNRSEANLTSAYGLYIRDEVTPSAVEQRTQIISLTSIINKGIDNAYVTIDALEGTGWDDHRTILEVQEIWID